jgi:ABC-type glycerol-3-phosphate transport system substrate-binding protein
MNGKKWNRILGLTLGILLLGAWGRSSAEATTATGATGNGVKLLFAHAARCPHCAYQRPIIQEFMTKHPEVAVSWVWYSDLNREQRKLIEGTSGHPVMVFHKGRHVRQVAGETSPAELEQHYQAFLDQMAETRGSSPSTGTRTSTGSGIVCY